MKLLKDIFGRKTSIWLSLELVLVTFACWWAFDPVLVSSYVTHLPLGYEPDRLVCFVVTGNNESEEESLLKKVQEMDGVELAYRAHLLPIGFGAEGSLLDSLIHNGDSIQTRRFHVMEGDKIFEVLGIESLTPEVPTSELTRDCERERTVILTRSLAMGLFGTIDVAGRSVKGYFIDWDDDKQTTVWLTKDLLIRAVVEDVRYDTYDHDYTNLFMCSYGPRTGGPIIARLREGVNAKRFMEEHRQEMLSDLVTEHCHVSQMQTARQIEEQTTGRYHIHRMTRRNLLIAAFFAINLAFGVFGTLLMYTRQRREEAGIKRAFGATCWSVFWGFIREAWLLTTISVIVGCAIYFQFATSRGLVNTFTSSNPGVHFWFDDFGTHFFVVSVIVYLIILCAVLIATAIPAWRICRSTITEAIKEE